MPEAPHITVEEINFEGLYEREYPGLIAVATALSGRDAEDLVHDAMVKALINWSRVRRLERPGGWCHRVLVNLCRSRWRRSMTEARFLARSRREEPFSDAPSADVIAFWAAVRELPSRPRLAVTLHYAGDRSTAEIATILEVPEGTVRSDLSRVRESLSLRLWRRDMTNEPQLNSGADDRIDELGRRAGAALRRPAPADGMARVHTSRRRRQVAQAAAGGLAAVVLIAGGFLVFDRDSDREHVVTDSTPDTVVDTVEDTVDDTVAPSTPIPTTAPPTTSVSPDESTWAPAVSDFPDLAYIACCGTDWEGQPSPAVPADPSAPLAPGIYHLREVEGSPPADGHVALEVRPYMLCTDGEAVLCYGGEPYSDTALGLPIEPSRTIDFSLDDSIQVAIAGFNCEGDQLIDDRQVGTGTELATLFAELDAAYESAVGGPLREGVDQAEIAAALDAGSEGFVDPGCETYTRYAWDPAEGPTILAPLVLDTTGQVPPPQPLASAAASWIHPTALVVDEQGRYTLYLYSGFLS